MSLVTQSPSHGAFTHYSLAFADRAAVLPASIPFSAGAVLPLALSTAAEGLYLPHEENFLGLPPPSLTPETGTKVLVLWGASSSVGATVLQLARASGVRVVGTASSRNHELVKGWGASGVVDYGDGEVVRKVVEEVKGLGGEFVGVYDAISSAEGSYPPVLEIAKLLGGGKVVVVRAPPAADEIPEGVEVGAVFAGNPIRHKVWEEFVTPALEKGALKCWPEPLIVGKGLERVQEGLDTNKRGVSARKVVIELGE